MRVSCQAVERGTVRLKVSRRDARRLGLKRRTLARATVRCAAEGRATVRIVPRGKARRVLRRARRALDATLVLRMAGSAGDVTDRAEVVLRGTGRR